MLESCGMTVRICVLLFGAWLFASSTEVLVHEAGHVLAGWSQGATIERFDAHPFRRSEVSVSYGGGRRAESSLWFSSAGILVALGVGGLGYFLARGRSYYWLPLAMLLPAACFAEGSYLIGGSLGNYGDPSAIASLAYLPASLLAGLGGVMVAGALVLGLRLMAHTGVDEGATWWRRVLAFMAVASVGLPGGVYALEAQESWPQTAKFLLVGTGLLAVMALFAGLLVHAVRRKLRWVLGGPSLRVTWPQALATLCAAVVVTGVMLAWSRR